MKTLEDGSKAVGLCNRGEVSAEITATWSEVGVTGRQTVRDLWRHLDLGDFAGQFTAVVQRHGVKLLRVQKAGP